MGHLIRRRNRGSRIRQQFTKARSELFLRRIENVEPAPHQSKSAAELGGVIAAFTLEHHRNAGRSRRSA
ncbi:hypothetical protein A8B73_18995 [Methylosinus sp. 3S-1]|nr:hypothetical protein A8B73_18995 [Methylosinus sp. 3S-1]